MGFRPMPGISPRWSCSCATTVGLTVLTQTPLIIVTFSRWWLGVPSQNVSPRRWSCRSWSRQWRSPILNLGSAPWCTQFPCRSHPSFCRRGRGTLRPRLRLMMGNDIMIAVVRTRRRHRTLLVVPPGPRSTCGWARFQMRLGRWCQGGSLAL